jgi:hypothetical protein
MDSVAVERLRLAIKRAAEDVEVLPSGLVLGVEDHGFATRFDFDLREIHGQRA